MARQKQNQRKQPKRSLNVDEENNHKTQLNKKSRHNLNMGDNSSEISRVEDESYHARAQSTDRNDTTNTKLAPNEFVNDRTIYVEGLPFEANEDEVRSFFSECGNIKSIRLPKWHDSGRLRGYGHVEFSNTDGVKKAFDLDGCNFLETSRFVKISKPKIPRAYDVNQLQNSNTTTSDPTNTTKKIRPIGCKTIFIKNLPYTCTEKEIKDAFQVCGPIITVRLASWGHTQSQKGFGYIEFKREDSAEIAVKKSGQINIQNRPIIIDYETGAPKGSYRNPLQAGGSGSSASSSSFSSKKKEEPTHTSHKRNDIEKEQSDEE